MRLGEVEPVFGQTGRVVLDITARTAHDGALKWTRAPSTPRAARSILATFPSTCALPSGGRWSLRRVLQRPGRQRKRSSAKSSCGPSRTSSSAPSSPPCCNARLRSAAVGDAASALVRHLPRRMRSDGLETVNVRTSRGTTVPVTTPYYREKHARRAKRRPGLYPDSAPDSAHPLLSGLQPGLILITAPGRFGRPLRPTGPGVDAQAPARTPRSTHPGGGRRVRIRRVANLVSNLVGAEAVLKLRVLRSQPRLRCVLELPRRGSTSGTTPSDTLME